ncbi:MAG: DUF6383 domain-containing protein [Muribaculaceae bacterium]
MLRRRLFILAVGLWVMMMPIADAHAQMQWRESSQPVSVPSLNDPRQSDGVEIFGVNSSIIVRTPHRVQVRVFTILGQMVSQAVLNAGTSELKINSRGIYIVKIGNVTQKVAL